MLYNRAIVTTLNKNDHFVSIGLKVGVAQTLKHSPPIHFEILFIYFSRTHQKVNKLAQVLIIEVNFYVIHFLCYHMTHNELYQLQLSN